MRTVIVAVCCVGVAFLLRVLVALAHDWMIARRKISLKRFAGSSGRNALVLLQGQSDGGKAAVRSTWKNSLGLASGVALTIPIYADWAAQGNSRLWWHRDGGARGERKAGIGRRSLHFRGGHDTFVLLVVMAICAGVVHAQQLGYTREGVETPDVQKLQARVETLENEVSTLKSLVQQLQAGQSQPHPTLSAVSTTAVNAPAAESVLSSNDRKLLDSLRQTTINVGVDTYYGYNFNNPVGRVNLLRAYDVLSNEFSLNQASAVLEQAPDVEAGRRLGGRLDLQFGQATDAGQGNPANEPRPQVYRNIFQAYGTYVAPVGKGLTVDFGKWASSLGIEGNYTKDQLNYSRSFWFYFLPFYHMGVRTSLPINNRFTVNYSLVNGTNQVEAVNGFKDELFGFTAKPAKSVTWTFNYYFGQENPDRLPAANCGPVPVEPGLCFTAISPAPNGRTHIFDTNATWQATPKLTVAVEGDYLIQRQWKTAALGQSSAPAHVDGGAAYIQYQVTPRIALASRAEYMSDRQGIFSGIGQALKENTVTFDYRLADNFLMRYEWRRDFSNQPSFLSDTQGVLKKDQNTATMGLVWWWGRKQGTW